MTHMHTYPYTQQPLQIQMFTLSIPCKHTRNSHTHSILANDTHAHISITHNSPYKYKCLHSRILEPQNKTASCITYKHPHQKNRHTKAVKPHTYLRTHERTHSWTQQLAYNIQALSHQSIITDTQAKRAFQHITLALNLTTSQDKDLQTNTQDHTLNLKCQTNTPLEPCKQYTKLANSLHSHK